jgi:1-acyl-sn-glycerol-3-phosphate acyltransferase
VRVKSGPIWVRKVFNCLSSYKMQIFKEKSIVTKIIMKFSYFRCLLVFVHQYLKLQVNNFIWYT